MLERVADLTWKRPKAVLAAVFAFVVVAGVFGHDVERHLKAAGSPTAPPRASGRPSSCAPSLATTPRRASCCWSGPRTTAAGRAQSRRPARGRAPGTRAAPHRARGQGGQPAARPARGAGADRARRPLAGAVGPPVDPGHRGRGRRRGRGGQAAVASEHARRADGRVRAVVQRGQRPDPRGPDEGRADRLPDPGAAAARGLPRRGGGGDPAGDRGVLDPGRVPDAAPDVGRRGHVAVRAEHRHGAEPGPGGGLRAADGLALPRGDRARPAPPARRTARW